MTASRIRVLHLVQNLNYGGMERLIAEVARGADPGRFEMHVMALQYLGRFARGLEGHATLHLAPEMEPWSLVYPGGLAARIGRIRPDVVHTHSGVWLKGARAARLAGVTRVVHTEHGRAHPDPWTDRWSDRIAARNTDVVAAVSRPLATHLERRVLGRGTPVTLIANGVDTDAFRPGSAGDALRVELGLSPTVPIIASVGRLEPVKGYDLAVRALAALGPRPAGAAPVLVIAGDGSQREPLRALARELGVIHRIRFLGWRDALAPLHDAAAVFTLASRSEGTCVGLLEAMSAGCCPVVTAVGGNVDVLGAELRHRLVPPEDPEALAAAWLDALADPARRASDGRQARTRVVEHFSARAMVRGYERLYEAARPAPIVRAVPALAGAYR